MHVIKPRLLLLLILNRQLSGCRFPGLNQSSLCPKSASCRKNSKRPTWENETTRKTTTIKAQRVRSSYSNPIKRSCTSTCRTKSRTGKHEIGAKTSRSCCFWEVFHKGGTHTHTAAAPQGQISRRRAETHQKTEEGRYECGDESETGGIAVYTLG